MLPTQNRGRIAPSVGDIVYFWHDQNGCFGPAEVIQVSPRQVAVHHNGHAQKFSINSIQRAFDQSTAVVRHATTDPISQPCIIHLLDNDDPDDVSCLTSAVAHGVTPDAQKLHQALQTDLTPPVPTVYTEDPSLLPTPCGPDIEVKLVSSTRHRHSNPPRQL